MADHQEDGAAVSEVLPVHWPTPVASSMLLWGGSTTMRFSDGIETGTAELRWNWLPSPKLRLSTRSTLRDTLPIEPLGLDLDGADLHGQIPQPVRIRYGSETNLDFDLDEATVGDSTSSVQQMRFAMVNMPKFLGRKVKLGSQSWWGRLELDMKDWHVRLDRSPGIPEGSSEGPHGGFTLTHSGLLFRLDGSPFSISDARKIMSALWVWSTLFKGAYSGPIYWQGEDSADNVVWTHHQAWNLDPWITDHGIFPSAVAHHEDPSTEAALGNCLQRCYDLLEDDEWYDILLRLLSWYTGANNGLSDSDIVLAQAGLELLSYAVVVLSETLPPDGFDRLRASDQIQILLSKLDLSLSVPESLGRLFRYAKGKNGQSAPGTITDFRNSLIHPPTKKRDRPGALDAVARIEARTLSVALLEQSLLALLGYDSWYRDRLNGWFTNKMRDD
jgi:hypothetical protein